MKFQEFLNPKSMLTPAIAGSVIMIIANTLWIQFALPAKWSALILSFVFLVPVLRAYNAALLEKSIYFFFNGLIVFSLAVNSNFAGRVLSNIGNESAASEPNVALLHSFSIISSAHAQDKVETKTTTTTTSTTTTSKNKNTTTTNDHDKTKKKKDAKENRDFFDPWL